MRKAFLVAGLLLAIGVAQAKATVIFTPGNNPQADEANILFGAAESGSTITGTIDSTTIDVSFSSLTSQTLSQTSAGQADISAVGGNLTSLDIMVAGYGFGDFIMNPFFGTGNLTVTAIDLNDVSSSFAYALGNGQNFLTITTDGGTLMKEIQLTFLSGGSFIDFKQPRISGVCEIVRDSCIPVSIPEPSTFALMGSGLVAFYLLFLFKFRANWRNRLFRSHQPVTV
jgi:hypothetical protein